MTGRRRKPWKRPKDLPKGEIWPPDQGLHPIPESWKDRQVRLPPLRPLFGVFFIFEFTNIWQLRIDLGRECPHTFLQTIPSVPNVPAAVS